MGAPERSIIANIPRLERYMDANGFDAIAVRTGANFTYLAGIALPGTLARHLDLANTVRGFMLVWPRKGEPVIVLDAFAEKVVARDSWVKKTVIYKAYVESLYTRVAHVLADLGLGSARVGFERDGLSAAHWQEIQNELPKLHMVNCSRMMDEVRWVKTAGEIALQKTAADMLDDVLLEVFPTIRPGQTEREVHARIVEACLRQGFGWVHGILNSSTNLVMYGGESDVKFQRGDFVRNDYVAYYKGYAGHQSRLAIIGKPNDEQQKAYAMTVDIHRRTIERCTAGRTAGDVFQFVVDEFRKRGIEYPASLVGHSMGPWFHQQEPVLRNGSDTVLEDGMILAIEPQRLHWHIQDLILIEGNKPRLLSDKFPTDQPFTIN
ncbi:MAG TPA: Xaa-Pro peptidase family protein [Pseudolabrys sp.]|nr:Xaa-Pro peptidase family protein [Pseudolabrys sp.]